MVIFTMSLHMYLDVLVEWRHRKEHFLEMLHHSLNKSQTNPDKVYMHILPVSLPGL